jgi:cysteine-S-conjugate beta-lyase
MRYNFDTVVDRRGTDTYKYEYCDYYFGSADILPLWVADMDFETPDFILNAIKERIQHPVLGYTILKDDFAQTIAAWLQRRHHWQPDTNHIKFMPGVLPSISLAIKCFSKKGDRVIVQPPIYPPFISIPKANEREVLYNKLKRVENEYVFDRADFIKCAEKGASVFVLCNPHNPGGIVWSRDVLAEIADICHHYKILVISDEIHADLVHPGYEHIPFTTVSKKATENSITLMAPSKTFNMAGLGSSFAIVPNNKIRAGYYRYLNALHVSHGSVLSYEATKAAFTYGDEWLDEMLKYLVGNFEFAYRFIAENMPQVVPFRAQASFLLWLDFGKLGIKDNDLKKLLVQKGKIGMNQGPSFGPGGKGFQRLNLGTPRTVLAEALTRIADAIK